MAHVYVAACESVLGYRRLQRTIIDRTFALVAAIAMASVSNPHADESTRVVAAVAAVTSVAALTVGARLYVRAFMIRSFGWDVGYTCVAEHSQSLTM